ncbi:hypothetical protein H5410_000555, partial [Solanum commersonii]
KYMGYVNLVFFMIYPFLFELVFSSSSPHLCPKDQALSLLQFKHMFTIDPNVSDYCIGIRGQWIQSYPKTLSWNKSTDCCSWDGFHFNSSLFQLSNLKRLDLSYNDFSGSLISPKFGEFPSLTHLDLLLTSFTGLIPAEISHLSRLRVLRILSDYGVRFGPNNFELFLKNLTQLRELDLNFLRGILPKRVFHLSNLESLDLTNNPQLTVRFPTTKWNTSASLMELYLSGVNFTGKIPESFSHLTSLLDLVMRPISPFLRFGKLREFSLRNNNFDLQLEYLPFNRSWTQLETLDFSSNYLTGPIPSGVSGLQNLQSLSLSSKHLNRTIPSWIFSLPSLFDLDLSDNHFSGKIQEFKSQTLFSISVKQNQLEGPIPNDEGVPQATTPFGLDQEGDSSMISWQAVLMGYGCGLVIGLSVIYIMLSIRYPVWFSRMDVELEHKILTRMKKYKKGYVTSRLMIVFHQKIEETSGNHGPKLQSATLAVKKLEKQPRKPKLEF